MSLPGGSVKRSGPVLLHRRSGASHAAVRKAHVHTCIHWMRACMCVCEPIHVHLHAHITRYVHTVYTCVGIHTHTCAYTHTQTCTQDTNPKLWDARVQEKKRNHVTIVYTYIHIHKYSQYKKNIDPYMKVFKIQTLNSQDANSRGNNPESIMQLHMYVHAQMYVFVHRQVCIHIYISMYTCACICMHVVNRYISLNPVHAKPRRILP